MSHNHLPKQPIDYTIESLRRYAEKYSQHAPWETYSSFGPSFMYDASSTVFKGPLYVMTEPISNAIEKNQNSIALSIPRVIGGLSLWRGGIRNPEIRVGSTNVEWLTVWGNEDFESPLLDEVRHTLEVNPVAYVNEQKGDMISQGYQSEIRRYPYMETPDYFLNITRYSYPRDDDIAQQPRFKVSFDLPDHCSTMTRIGMPPVLGPADRIA